MSTTQSAPEKLATPPRRPAPAAAVGWFVDALLLLLALAVLGAAALLTLGGPEQVVLPWAQWVLPGTCTFKVVLGVGCPGCGLTRCFVSMAHGDLAAAWRFSPVGIFLFTLLAVQVPYRGWRLWRATQGQRLPYCSHRQMHATLWILGTVIGLLALQWILRLSLGNVP